MKLEVAISSGVIVVGVLIGIALLFYAASSGGAGDYDEATSESRGEIQAAQVEYV